VSPTGGARRLLRSFSIYFVCTLLNQAIGFLLLPVFTRYLTPQDYGTLSLVTNGITVFSLLIMVGADGAVRREFYRAKGRDYAGFLSSAFLTTVCAFSVVLLLSFLISFWIESLAGIPRKWLLLSPVIGFAAVSPAILLGQLRVNQEAGWFGLFSISMTLANLGLGLWLVVGRGMGYEGRLYSLLGSGLLFSAVALLVLHRKQLLVRTVRWAHASASLRYGLPIIPHQLGALVISFADRFFIAGMVSLSEAGIYHVGYTIGSVVAVVESTFSFAFTPYLFERLKEDTDAARRSVVRMSYLFLAGLAGCVALLYLSSEILFARIVGPQFAAGKTYVLWIAIAYFFSGCYKMVVGYIFFSSKTIYLTYLAILNVAVSVSLNYLLIKRWGAVGAAWSTLLSFLLMFLVTAWLSQRLIPMPWLGPRKTTDQA
jgi:O-antigen/teichoic acid export membrane protein